MSLEERVHKGTRAKEILENEVFAEAFNQIEQEVIEQWKLSPARDEAGREKLWIYHQLLQRVRKQLESTMETGKLAELDLQHQRSILSRVRSGIGL